MQPSYIVGAVGKNGRNPIWEYKQAAGLTYEQLAGLWGVKVDYLRKLGCGMHRPGVALAKRIEAASRGKVSAIDLVFGSER